jgi:CRISPR-associated protein Csm3
MLGRVFLGGEIEARTGLRIGGSPGALAIGNVDLPVIREGLTKRPYIPGSSLKGKMRSLSEKFSGAPQNRSIGKGVKIHVAGGDRHEYPDGRQGDEQMAHKGAEQYGQYWVNPVFGVPGEVKFDVPAPNRLVVRDVPLRDESADELNSAKTDLPFTEVKWEAAIDRVTAAATPRQIERVPAGAVFGPMEIVFNAYLPGDAELFWHVVDAMQLLEDDYLGGHGSRGSGKISFRNLSVKLRHGAQYAEDETTFTADDLPGLVAQKSAVVEWLKGRLAK